MKKLLASFIILASALCTSSYAEMRDVCLDSLCLGGEMATINRPLAKYQAVQNLNWFADGLRQKLGKHTHNLNPSDIEVIIRHYIPGPGLVFALDDETADILKMKSPIFCEFSFFIGVFDSKSGYKTQVTIGTTGRQKFEILKLERWFTGLNSAEKDSLEKELWKRYANSKGAVDVGDPEGFNTMDKLKLTLTSLKFRKLGEMGLSESMTQTLSKETGCRKTVPLD